MAQRFRTESGGRDDRMRNTRWSQVMLVRDGDTAQRSSALGTIARQYWKPIYAYLMRKGLTNEVAKDLTQGFFHDVVLERHLVEKADPEKGPKITPWHFLICRHFSCVAVVKSEALSQSHPMSSEM